MQKRKFWYTIERKTNSRHGVIPMKFLILSAATGQGHNSAALAVKECLEARNNEAKVLDVLKLKGKNISKRVSKLYAGVTVHTPRFFHGLYRIGEHVSSPGGHSPIFRLNTLYAEKLHDVITRVQPDVIVCTHIFSAQAVTCLRERYDLKIPAAGVATDYTCIPFWEESSLDGYIIPSPALAGEFTSKGVPAGKLAPIGIPVRPEFLTRTPKAEARLAFGLTAAHIFLVMGGSMGYGKIGELASALTAAVPDSQAVVLCGSNEKLFREMNSVKNSLPLRYTDRVCALMDTADVILTKPGGLSSTEAIAKRIPTVLTHPIPGCEQRNAEFLSALGAAAFADGTQSAVCAAHRLALDEYAARKMKRAQERVWPGGTDSRIADYLIVLGNTACAGRPD